MSREAPAVSYITTLKRMYVGLALNNYVLVCNLRHKKRGVTDFLCPAVNLYVCLWHRSSKTNGPTLIRLHLFES